MSGVLSTLFQNNNTINNSFIQMRRKKLKYTPLEIINSYISDFNNEWRRGGNIGEHQRAYQSLFNNEIFNVLNICWSHAIYKGK